MMDPARIPVIIGIGEAVDRPERLDVALEPVALMEAALLAADQDAGGGLLERIESVELVGLVSWRYADPVALLCERLAINAARKINASMGGDTPTRLIHEAALRIASGEEQVAAIVGGEATHSRNAARKGRVTLPWTPMASRDDAVRFPSSRFAVSDVARRLGVVDPAQIYPFYEMAAQHGWGQTPAAAQRDSAFLWERYANVAATNPSAWIRTAPSAERIEEVTPDNRLINFPYPKLMVANPAVNQGGAVIVTSLAVAQSLGVEARAVHIWGGAYAAEPEDYLGRDRYDRSTAQAAVLDAAVALVEGGPSALRYIELYSCFPVVPKMAARALGLGHAVEPTVTGGLTFFGGPLNNYMTHATCAMVRALRANPDEVGLLYGQGGYVNKHHALVLSARQAPSALACDFSVQATADAARDPVPEVLDIYQGPATVETYTIRYARDGGPLEGIVVLRTPDGARTMARVPEADGATISMLQDMDRSAIGTSGYVRVDAFDLPVFEAGEKREPATRPRRYCTVEHDGPLTIVTINRPEAMNALTPAANAELSEVFDAFAADPNQWVAILTGAGERAFCAGNDLKEMVRDMARGASIGHPVKGFAGLTSRFDLTKPVIAAVNGVAMGGGLEIALACDIVVADEAATFALPEPRVGVAALAGGLLRLPRQIGQKQAMGMILTGRKVEAAEALRLGFVNEVVPAGEALSGARRWAEQMLACSPMSIRASKEIVQRTLATPSLADAEAEQAASSALRALYRSADFREGPLAFAQKRPPRWTGR